ncbi:MAG: type III effector [Nocardioidaceae bacterium]
MSNQTGKRKGLRSAALVAASAGLVFALPTAPASAGTQDPPIAHCQTASGDASDLSPSTQKAWADFVCGGAHLAGGTARVISGAYFGAPAFFVVATGGEMSDTQMDAWKNFDRGANQGGKGAAMLVSGAYVGAPGYIIDKIESGATPGDLSGSELRQTSFMVPADSELLPTDMLPTDQLPTDTLDPASFLSLF